MEVNEQQDAFEVLMFLFQEIEARTRTESNLYEPPYYIHVINTMQCPYCKTHYEFGQNDFLSTILISEHSKEITAHLESLLVSNNFVSEPNEERVCCNSEIPRELFQLIEKLPRILILVINRFHYERGQRRKLHFPQLTLRF